MLARCVASRTNLTTTMRYMHLSPAARTNAIGLLRPADDAGTDGEDQNFGEIVETSVS